MYFSSEQENLSISKSTSADVQYCIYIDIDTLISLSKFTLWAGDQSSCGKSSGQYIAFGGRPVTRHNCIGEPQWAAKDSLASH